MRHTIGPWYAARPTAPPDHTPLSTHAGGHLPKPATRCERRLRHRRRRSRSSVDQRRLHRHGQLGLLASGAAASGASVTTADALREHVHQLLRHQRHAAHRQRTLPGWARGSARRHVRPGHRLHRLRPAPATAASAYNTAVAAAFTSTGTAARAACVAASQLDPTHATVTAAGDPTHAGRPSSGASAAASLPQPNVPAGRWVARGQRRLPPLRQRHRLRRRRGSVLRAVRAGPFRTGNRPHHLLAVPPRLLRRCGGRRCVCAVRRQLVTHVDAPPRRRLRRPLRLRAGGLAARMAARRRWRMLGVPRGCGVRGRRRATRGAARLLGAPRGA